MTVLTPKLVTGTRHCGVMRSRAAMWFSWLIATRTCLRFRDGVTGTGLHRLPQAVGAGRLLKQADRRAASVPQARGRSGGRSAAERSAVAQRGKASSRSPTRRTLPTGSARRRGSRLGNRRQGAARRRRGSRAPARRLRGGGVARAPRRRRGQGIQGRHSTARSPTASSGPG